MADAKVVVTKESLLKIADSLQKKVDGLVWDSRVAARKLVVLELTNAEPQRINEARLVARDARSSVRRVRNELALLREAIASA